MKHLHFQIKLLTTLFVLSFIISLHTTAQSPELISPQDNIVKQAIAQLNSAMQPPKGDLYLFASENGITGTFTFDITIRKKGEVATVFVISSENASIQTQNLLKDHLKALRFNLTVPKKESRKFRHTFTF